MKSARVFLCLCIMATFLAACGGGGGVPFANPDIDVPDAPAPPTDELETTTLEEVGGDEVWARVIPNINSKEDLIAYRAMKIAEIEDILDLTEDQMANKSYYQTVITMKKPIPLAQFLNILRSYNPTMDKILKSVKTPNYIPKAETVKDEDMLIVNVVRFRATSGGGQLGADTLSNPEELAKLEMELGKRIKKHTGKDNFQLVQGVTSIMGGIHRDKVLEIQDAPDVFLADIGPIELYEGTADRASWNDIYTQVEEYLNQ